MTNLEIIRTAVITANPEIIAQTCNQCANFGCSEHIRNGSDRPIRLSDVLLAIEEKSNKAILLDTRGRLTDVQTATSNGFNNAVQWNLAQDVLTLQSEPTLEFLANLLK